MIQRIQTLYLLAIVILSGFVIFFPLADLVNVKDHLLYLVDFRGISLIQPTGNILKSPLWGVSTFAAVVPVITLITIFSYKNRKKQIRLSVINMLFMILFYVSLFIYLFMANNSLNTEWHLKLVSVFPLVNMILNYLAIGAIGKDENLVKSLDRLR